MANEALLTSTTRHQVYLERLKSGEANQFASFLKEIDRSLRLRLGGADITEFSRQRVETLLAQVEFDLRRIFGTYYEELAGHLVDLGEYEAQFEARNLSKAARDFEAVIPSSQQVRAAIFAAPLSIRTADGGNLLEPFLRGWTANEVKRVSGAIRRGFYEGQTTSQVLQAVRGTKANGYRDGILSITSRSANTVVRTAIQHVASVSRMETWRENESVIRGYEWVSTLDGRTSQICRSLDGKVFKLGKGPVPPVHPNCRSTTVAVLRKELAFLSEGATRASKDGPVSGQETYYSWLQKQPAAFQDSAIGPTRGKLLREGGLSAERFAELNVGRNFEPLTLDEMRKLEPLAFERSGL